ncbi:MAG: hypothetical protein ACOCQR_03680 [bacterium]
MFGFSKEEKYEIALKRAEINVYNKINSAAASKESLKNCTNIVEFKDNVNPIISDKLYKFCMNILSFAEVLEIVKTNSKLIKSNPVETSKSIEKNIRVNIFNQMIKDYHLTSLFLSLQEEVNYMELSDQEVFNLITLKYNSGEIPVKIEGANAGKLLAYVMNNGIYLKPHHMKGVKLVEDVFDSFLVIDKLLKSIGSFKNTRLYIGGILVREA